jgi:CheY-like chemotaxis protein
MRILLVEDEPAVQEVIVTMLERAGHLVVTETNGNKAFRRYRKEGPFDLVLTDIQHKGMNGVELMQTIHRKNRKQHVRLVTGWPILQKPFTQKQLLDFIKIP